MLSPAWRDELARRIDEHDAARARGERGGVAMGLDELIDHLRREAHLVEWSSPPKAASSASPRGR